MKEAGVPGEEHESDRQDPFQDLGDSFLEDDYAKGVRRVVRELARFIEDYAICVLKGWVMVPYFHQRGEEGEEYF